jgi:hypothetical protein
VTARRKPLRRLRANRRILKALTASLEAAKAAADDSEASRCGVEPEHRRAMALYLTTWVIHPLQTALADMQPRPLAEKPRRRA